MAIIKLVAISIAPLILGLSLGSDISESGDDVSDNEHRQQLAAKNEITGTKSDQMIFIPAGEFVMGNSQEEAGKWFAVCEKYYGACHKPTFDAETPKHKVYLDGYYIDKYEVTVEQYATCIKKGKCTQPKTGEYCNWGKPDRNRHPVTCIDWTQAKTYCEWAGKRLPTEAEWEKSAAGPEQNTFAWGQVWSSENANYCDLSCDAQWRDISSNDGYSETSPVGNYPKGASSYGAMDMSGNVWEWVSDWYGETYYKISPRRNPKGPTSGQFKVLRGGAWSCSPNGLRTTNRYATYADDCGFDIGVRCVKSSPN